MALVATLSAIEAPEEKSPVLGSLLEELAEPKFQFSRTKRGKERRDPFQPPAQMVRVLVRTAAGEARERIYTLAHERVLAQVAEEMLGEMKRRSARKDYQGVRLLRDKLVPLLATDFYDPEANRRFTAVRNQVRAISVALIYYDVLRLTSRMRQSFSMGEYEAVGKLYEELLQVAGEDNGPKPFKLTLLLQIASLLSKRATIRLEFYAQEIPISFIAWTPEAPLAIVKNKIVAPSDLVSPGLQVYQIEKEHVIFRYKGEVMAKSMVE